MEMEQAREDDLADYWLAQLQRVLDRKPQSQIDRVGWGRVADM